MRLQWLVIPVAFFLLGAEGAEEAKKLQGTWTAETLEVKEKKLPAELIKSILVTIKGDELTLQIAGREEKGTFKLDSSKKPKTLDFKAKGREKSTQFIYELDGKTLKLCWRKGDQKRPTEFTSKGANSLMILKKKD